MAIMYEEYTLNSYINSAETFFTFACRNFSCNCVLSFSFIVIYGNSHVILILNEAFSPLGQDLDDYDST